MARTIEFNRNEALDAAIRVFARHGFSAASTTDLLEAMGIARQSLYGAFGDKRGLFLEALDRYSERSLSRMLKSMTGKGSASAAIEAAVLLDLACDGDLETGCLGVGSIVEFGRTDVDINALGDQTGMALVAAFADQIRKGVAAGEMRSDLDPDAAGKMLLILKSGLKVASRGGASAADAKLSVRLVLDGFSAR